MFVRLSDQKSWEMLSRSRVARLGCVTDNGPYITPINYYLEDNCAYSHSLPGLKITALRHDPRACLQAEEVENDYRWRSVLAFGRYEEVTGHTERKEVLGKLLTRFPLLTPVETAIADDGAPPPVLVFRIRIESVTGVAEE